MPTFVPDEIVTAAKLNAATARDWTTWTPTTGGITLGSGVIVARWSQVGNIAFCNFTFTLAAGSAITAGVTVTGPVTGFGYGTALAPGTARLTDAGTASFTGAVIQNSTTVFEIRSVKADMADGQYEALSSTNPFTWTATDIIGASWFYEVA